MAEDDLKDDLRGLREQIEALREALAAAAQPYAQLVASMERLQEIARGYFRLLDLYQRHGSISPDLVVPGLKDDISRHIVAALFERQDRNISQITDAVKGRRGTASRRIVRERLADLEREGIVIATPGVRSRTFRVSDEVRARWSQVLGLPKYGDQPYEGSDKAGERNG